MRRYTEAVKPPAREVSAKELYEQDFFLWTISNAELLRAGRLSEADLEHIAEEIEDMGKSERRERNSRLRVLLTHLLKWAWQPDKRTNSWKATLARERMELHALLHDSPSLNRIEQVLPQIFREAVRQARIETGVPESSFPDQCPFAPEQILDTEFLPE